MCQVHWIYCWGLLPPQVDSLTHVESSEPGQRLLRGSVCNGTLTHGISDYIGQLFGKRSCHVNQDRRSITPSSRIGEQLSRCLPFRLAVNINPGIKPLLPATHLWKGDCLCQQTVPTEHTASAGRARWHIHRRKTHSVTAASTLYLTSC